MGVGAGVDALGAGAPASDAPLGQSPARPSLSVLLWPPPLTLRGCRCWPLPARSCLRRRSSATGWGAGWAPGALHRSSKRPQQRRGAHQRRMRHTASSGVALSSGGRACVQP